ncbi:MAG: Zn-dependent hydrolase [Chloroflexi bacterium]|nr:Zn-dependent hydrolase [Chloroflexota bacterium]
MKDKIESLRITGDRFKRDFDALAEVGSTGDGGVNRPALSEAHVAARRWFRERVEADGLEFHADGAGNHSAILRCGKAGAKTLLLGSHLDSVPRGGRFDGALGVTSALEVLRAVRDAAVSLPVDLEAIDFTDEEGTLCELLGSRALVGAIDAEHLKTPRGGRAELEEGMARAGLTDDGVLSAKRDPATLAGYLELHIEQGPRLISAGATIGVVTGIVGIRSFRLTFGGRADHAGTTPMDVRADASLGASGFVLAARELVMRGFPNCVVNVGQMRLEPGAFNIVPAQAVLALEFRSPEIGELERLQSALLDRARAAADRFGLTLTAEPLGRVAPTRMHDDVRAAITSAAERLVLRHLAFHSGAGHDAMMLARITRAGMFFVPSIGGASHSPREFTEWEDCVRGANVLLNSAVGLVDHA